MSFRSLELSPGTRKTRLTIVARVPGGAFPEASPQILASGIWNIDSADLGFEADDAEGEERSKWNMFLGLLVVLAVSGTFWTGFGLLVARLVR